jgi:hypothetical protein
VALGRCVSFQITILKVLAGSPGGRLPLADLRHDVAILVSSGRDWTEVTERITARAPNLDIFSQAFVVREPTGWYITGLPDFGRKASSALGAAGGGLTSGGRSGNGCSAGGAPGRNKPAAPSSASTSHWGRARFCRISATVTCATGDQR